MPSYTGDISSSCLNPTSTKHCFHRVPKAERWECSTPVSYAQSQSVYLPSAEQRAIAEALSDVDALINALDALITKKRQIKQGTMQQLLTGKKRLPGFDPVNDVLKQTEAGRIPGDWDVKPLQEVFHFTGGKAHEPFVTEHGQFVVVNSKFVSTEGRVRKGIECDRNISPAEKGSILMVMSDLPNGKALAKCFLVDKDNVYAVNQRVCSLKAKRDCSAYLYYALNRNPYFLKFNDGVSQTHLLNPIVLACPVVVPRDVKEQEAIATVLQEYGNSRSPPSNKSGTKRS